MALAEDGTQRDAARPAGIDERLAEGLEPAAVAVYPPVVEYSAEFRARAADGLELLPERSAIVELLSDYGVMREQGRVCRRV